VLSDLRRDLHRFRDAAASASQTAVDDRPSEDIPRPLESCIDAICDLHVLAHELLASLTAATAEGRAMREGLIVAHEGINRLRDPLKKATSSESVTSLARIGQSRRRAWQLWTAAMRDALHHLDDGFAPLDERLLACWKTISAAA
jgi:hypothetical protein